MVEPVGPLSTAAKDYFFCRSLNLRPAELLLSAPPRVPAQKRKEANEENRDYEENRERIA